VIKLFLRDSLGILQKPRWIVIPNPWLKPLYGALLLEVAAIGIVPFRNHILPKIEQKSIPKILQDVKAVRVDDYLRIFFLKREKPFSGKLGRQEAARVFVAPSLMFNPPVSLGEACMLTGNDYGKDEDVYIIRCQPNDIRPLDPLLATWKTVFDLIRSEFQEKAFDCGRATTDEAKAYCIVASYSDRADLIPTVTLAEMFDTAAKLYQANLDAFLKTKYGISKSSFAGLGMTVRGTGVPKAFHSGELLASTNLPEYLVKNVDLREGSCKCVIVTPYE
jgi:hypothetical protein